MTNSHADFFHSISPSANALLIHLRPLLTDDIVLEMAKSDVDLDPEVTANKAVLTNYRDTGVVPGELPWNPAEVCNLLRWETRPDRDIAIQKLFASWILVRAYVQFDSLKSGIVDDGDEYALIMLAESALRLGDNFQRQAILFLSWAYLTLRDQEEYRSDVRPFYLFALLTIAAATPGSVSNEHLTDIALHLRVEEQRVRDAFAGSYEADHADFPLWLLGLNRGNIGNFQKRCRALVETVRNDLSGPLIGARRALLDDILAEWQTLK